MLKSVVFIFFNVLPALAVLSEDLTSHISNVVHYYEENYIEMNLDGIYGLRLLEGQLSTILDAFQNSDVKSEVPLDLFPKLESLYSRASATAKQSLRHVRNNNPAYYEKMGAVIEVPMDLDTQSKTVNPYQRWTNDQRKTDGFNEEFSDLCMTELLSKRCAKISTHCLASMFERGHQEYTITHQLLYIMLAKQYGCVDYLNEYLRQNTQWADVNAVELEFCSNNLFEVVEIIDELSEDKQIPPIYRDLFMEQQLVCPMVGGYMQFLHIDWLRQIMSWQQPSGCYGESSLVNNKAARQSYDAVVQNPQARTLLLMTHNSSAKELDKMADNHIGLRHLLEEKNLKDGCMAHETAVALGALSQYLKFIIHEYPPEYLEEVNLHGYNYLLANTWQNIEAERRKNIENMDKLERTRNRILFGDIDIALFNENKRKRARLFRINKNDPDSDFDSKKYGYDSKEDAIDDGKNSYDFEDIAAKMVMDTNNLVKPHNSVMEDDGNGDVDGDVGDGNGDVDDGNGDVDDGNGDVDDGNGDVDGGYGDVDDSNDDIDPVLPHVVNKEDFLRYAGEEKYSDEDSPVYALNVFGDVLHKIPGKHKAKDDFNGEYDGNYYQDDAAPAAPAVANPRFHHLLNNKDAFFNDRPDDVERNEDDDQDYSYDEIIHEDKQQQRLEQPRVAIVPRIDVVTRRYIDNNNNNNMKPLSGSDTNLSEGTVINTDNYSIFVSYGVIFSVMVLMLCLMFRFVRAKRVIIRYRYG